MEIREIAERVLFATSLEEKLRCPEEVTDARPGLPLAVPEAPGRPPELRFKAAASIRSDFPGIHRVESERGRLLHFFANHELLATELMALVLLRFPEAPPAFRRGVLKTLREEQAHTRLYLERMRACGVEFGSLPLSGYFWRCIAPMEHPIDYVAGLSLTFEQANLDYCRMFQRSFAAVGDAETAALLERIYRDEIGHVAYGLKWFRRWKDPAQSDWNAFCRQLRYPLSPQRAKGGELNAEGRRAAGLDAEFIAELNVFSQSRGRSPDVYVFNPFAEGHIARGRDFRPSPAQAELALDLANLPQFLSRKDDIVLVPRRPSTDFLTRLRTAGLDLPEFMELVPATRAGAVGQEDSARGRHGPACFEWRLPVGEGLQNRKLGRLRPWAWSPDSVELLEPCLANVAAEKRSAATRFNPAIAALYSKAGGAALLRDVLDGWKDASWLCGETEIGIVARTLEEALNAIESIRRRGHHRIVIKEDLGVAGHNSIRLWEPELLESQHRWLARRLGEGCPLVVEPWLERLADFSVQFEMGLEGLKLRGYTGLVTDLKGQFRGNWADPNHHRQIPFSITGLFVAPRDFRRRIHELYEHIRTLLEARLRAADHVGPVGIDAFVFRGADGAIRLKPVVEVNPRFTMGRLTLELMRHVAPGSRGEFRLVTRQVAARQLADRQGSERAPFPSYAREMLARAPIQLEGTPTARIREGALCLNDPDTARCCLAVFEVIRGSVAIT